MSGTLALLPLTGKYALKDKDVAMAAGFSFLREKGVFAVLIPLARHRHAHSPTLRHMLLM